MVQRLVLGLLTLLVFVTFLFVLAKVLIPGDFVTQFQFSLSLEEREALREGLGLTQPIWRQYLSFVGSLLTGDLGTSYYGNPVSSHIWFDTQATVLMFMTGMGVAYVAGQWMGRVAAWRSSSRWSNAIAFGSVMTYTVFPVLLAFILMVAFRKITGWTGFLEMRSLEVVDTDSFWILPATIGGTLAAVTVASKSRVRWGRAPIPGLVGLALVAVGSVGVWSLLGMRSFALDWMYLLSLPILAIALLSFGEITLIVKGAMSDVAHEDFVQTARAKGLSERMVRDRHAARVSLLPVVSKLMVNVPFFLAGLVIIETAFIQPLSSGLYIDVPGLSGILFSSLSERNVPVVVGGLFAVGLISLVIRVGLDVLLAFLDPRIRYSSTARSSG
jgi:peptide/nickel transport system permease protein